MLRFHDAFHVVFHDGFYVAFHNAFDEAIRVMFRVAFTFHVACAVVL